MHERRRTENSLSYLGDESQISSHFAQVLKDVLESKFYFTNK